MDSTPSVEVLLTGDPEEPSMGAGEPGIVTVAPALFARRGEFVAKGFDEPVRVYEVSWRTGV